MKGNAPVSKLTGVPGWLTEAEELHMLAMAQDVPAKGTIVEIGGEWGRSASIWCKGAKKDVAIITVDPFASDEVFEAHIHNLMEAGFTSRTSIVQERSEVAYTSFNDDSIDLLFIDGDHTYEAVKRDLELWSPKVKSGGIILMHDMGKGSGAHYLHYEVARAVQEFAEGHTWPFSGTLPDSLFAFYKPASAEKSIEELRATSEPQSKDEEREAVLSEEQSITKTRVSTAKTTKPRQRQTTRKKS